MGLLFIAINRNRSLNVTLNGELVSQNACLPDPTWAQLSSKQT